MVSNQLCIAWPVPSWVPLSHPLSTVENCDHVQASPCSSSRYWLTHITIWSLNVPLMTWWSKSGVKSSWMSARGKPCVNGYKSLLQNVNPKYEWVSHNNVRTNSKIAPKCSWIPSADEKVGLFMSLPAWVWSIEIISVRGVGARRR